MSQFQCSKKNMPPFLHKITKKFAYDLAIDLGSTNTVIFRKGSGIVVNEPSVIAVKRTLYGTSHVLTGSAVKKLLLEPYFGQVTLQKPVRHGAIVDFEAAREMLMQYLEPIRPWFPRSLRVLANVPCTASDQQKATIRKLLESAGAKEVYLMEEPHALAIGAGLDLSDERANMVVDIGGDTTEMAVLAGGKVVRACSLPIGGEHMDRAIAGYLRERYNLNIGDHAAERVKISIGDAYPVKLNKSIRVEGYDIADRTRGSAQVSGEEIREVLSKKIRLIITSIKAFLQALSPRESVDILDSGIALAGGGVLLPNLDLRLEQELMFPFRKVSDPLTCLAAGSGDALDYLNYFE